MRILFLIATLQSGGAERQVSVLAKAMSERGHKVKVVTLFPGGPYADELRKTADIELISIWPKKRNIKFLILLQILWAPFHLKILLEGTDVLYSMLGLTNLIAWIATRFSVQVKLVWGIRSTTLDESWKMAVFNRLCALVSKTIKLVIVNSYAGKENLFEYGFRPQKVQIILNGIDIDKFQFDERERKKIRQEFGILNHQQVIGIIGRIIPIKDHSTLIKAASLLSTKVNNLRVLVVGEGSVDYIDDLYTLVDNLGLADHVIWLGSRRDIVAIYSALDVLVSSSIGEGFSNVIGEAMSCGIPCVVTDVGDSAMIVGDPTRVVNPGDSEMMASAIYKVLRKNKEEGAMYSMRNRITDNFSISKLVDQTEKALEDVIQCQ
jgi:glycosyltransferase involved in cell wall biosynthesis